MLGSGSKSQLKCSNGENTGKPQSCSNINVPIESLKYHSQFGELHSNLWVVMSVAFGLKKMYKKIDFILLNT